MIGYHLVYDENNFSERLIEATKKLGNKPKKAIIEKYLKEVQSIFNISVKCTVKYKKECSAFNEGIYVNTSKEIIFYNRPTLITVLHEIRHYIQYNTTLNLAKLTYEDKEVEARAWSSSLFYSIYPNKYLNLCSKGKIKYY